MNQKAAINPSRQAVLDLLESHEKDALLSPDELDSHLAKRFKKFLQVAKRAPWWGSIIQDAQGEISQATSIQEILKCFPVLTRTTVQENAAQLLVGEIGPRGDGIGALTTSGSTGKPVTVFRHHKTHQIQHAATELLDVVWQKRDLTKNSAYFKVAPENDEQPSMGAPYTFLGPTGKVFRRSLATNTVPELLDFIVANDVQNFLLNPMVLKFLVREQRRSPRNLRFQQVMSWADRLEPALRTEVKHLFGAKICDRYSTTEFGFLAIQCPHAEHLHALQFNNYIEILDDDNQPCEIGQQGRVVVTSLQNLAMPLIRYEVGDLAAFAYPCSHGIGLPVFEPRIGRSREAIQLEDGSLEIPYFDDTAVAKHQDTVDYQGYRFKDGILLAFEAKSKIDDQTISQTQAKLQAVFKTAEKVRVVQIDSLEHLGLWKRKLIVEVQSFMPEEFTQAEIEHISSTS